MRGACLMMLASVAEVAAMVKEESSALRGAMVHDSMGSLAALAPETNAILEFMYYWKGTFSLALCAVVLTILNGAFKQDAGIGLVEADKSMQEGNVFEDVGAMTKLLDGKVQLQSRMSVSFFSLFMNQPWHEKPVGFKWGGDEPVSPNKEWMNGKVFPNGETQTDSPVKMIRAFWSFMLSWKSGGARTCIIISVLQGFVGPIGAQIFCWLMDEISTGTERSKIGPLKNLPGTSEQMLLIWCVLLVLLHVFDIYLTWQYEMEVPEGGVVRQFKLRLQQQFVAMKGEAADAWPAGRCQAVIQFDVGQLIGGIWIAVFSLSKYITGCVAIIAVTIYSNRSELLAMISWGWIFFFLFLASIFDVMSRLAHLQDLASRKQNWHSMECAMVSKQIHLSREQQIRSSPRSIESAAKLVEDASFAAWYRGAHSYLFGLASKLACQFLNCVALGIVGYAAGMMVIEGNMSMGHLLVLMLCIQLLAGVQSNVVSTVVKLLQAYPSLKIISEVLNTAVE